MRRDIWISGYSMSQKVVIYPLLAQLFVCVALFALPETSTVDEDGGEMTGATMINSSNSTHDDGAPSVQTAPHNDTRGPHGVHGDNHPAPEKEEPDYRNPFTYLPKPFVFAMIFIGAFLLMIFVCEYPRSGQSLWFGWLIKYKSAMPDILRYK